MVNKSIDSITEIFGRFHKPTIETDAFGFKKSSP